MLFKWYFLKFLIKVWLIDIKCLYLNVLRFIFHQVAERVATERDEECGENGSVGYQIRLERSVHH